MNAETIRVPPQEICGVASAFPPPPEVMWRDIIQEDRTVEGSILYIKGTEIPVRGVAMGLISNFKAELLKFSVNDLSQWLKQVDASHLPRNVNKAIEHVEKTWQCTPQAAWGTVLYIREFPGQIEKDLQQERKFFQAFK